MLDRLLETQEGIVVERALEDGVESFDGSVVVFKANDECATGAGLDLAREFEGRLDLGGRP